MTKVKPKKEKSPLRPVLIGMPAFDMMHTVTCRSLIGLAKENGTPHSFAIGSLVADARNRIVDDAFRMGVERILFVDSDMVFEPDMLYRMQACMTATGADVVCGIMTTRKHPIEPVIYKSLSWEEDENGYLKINKETYLDYPVDSVFEIAACGFGACLVTVDICKKIMGNYGAPFTPLPGLGEDLTFCIKAREAGGKIICDSRIKVGHMGQALYDELSYQNYNRLIAAAEAEEGKADDS